MNPQFKKYATNVFKAAAIMFTVGVILAFAAPTLASITGVAAGTLGTATNPLWTGLYFGGFGAISAAVTPVINKLVDFVGLKLTRGGATSLEISKDLKISPGPVVMAEAHQPDIAGTQFQDMITAKKAAAISGLTPGM